MKKKIILLSALGAVGGLLYALESQYKRSKSSQADSEADNNTVSGNALADDAKHDGSPQNKPAASMARIENGEASIADEGEHVIDDQGTDQSEASHILRHIRDHAFEANDEKLALALGRPTEEIEEWTSGRGLIDGDVILKARTLAIQRGFEI
jgi:hypothetical protein